MRTSMMQLIRRTIAVASCAMLIVTGCGQEGTVQNAGGGNDQVENSASDGKKFQNKQVEKYKNSSDNEASDNAEESSKSGDGAENNGSGQGGTGNADSGKGTPEKGDNKKGGAGKDNTSESNEPAYDYPEVYTELNDWEKYEEVNKTAYIDYHIEVLKLKEESAQKYPELAKMLEKYGDDLRAETYDLFESDCEELEPSANLAENPVHSYEQETFLRRADGKIFSAATFTGNFASYRDASTSWECINYDMEEEKEITLSDIVNDKEKLFDVLAERVGTTVSQWDAENYDSKNNFHPITDFSKYRKQIVYLDNNSGINFTIDPYGVTFYFNTYDFWMDDVVETIMFAEDKDGTLFNKDICQEMSEWIIQLPQMGSTSYYSDGGVQNLYIGAEATDGVVTGYYINPGRPELPDGVPTNGGAYEPRAFLVHRDDYSYLMLDYRSPGGYTVDIIDFEDIDIEQPYLASRVNGSIPALSDEETDFSKVDSNPKTVPLDPRNIRITPEGKKNCWVGYVIDDEGQLVENGKKDGFSLQDINDADYPSEKKAYEEILFYYKGVSDGKYTTDDLQNAGIVSALTEQGWPFTELPEMRAHVGYFLYDIDGNGVDELVITYMENIYDIYGFDGKKAVVAYNVPYRGEAFLYTDGKLKELWAAGSTSRVTWYGLSSSIGDFFPIAQKESSKNVTCYSYTAADNMEEIEKAYKESGNVPVWAYEYSDEISKSEFEKYGSKGEEITLPHINAVDQFDGF